MVTDHKIDNLLGPSGTFTGYSLMIFGVIGTYFNLTGLILVVAGMFITFTFDGTIIYTDAELGTRATWWTSSQDISDKPPMNALITGLSYDFHSRTGGTNPKEDAYSVRCKKDD